MILLRMLLMRMSWKILRNQQLMILRRKSSLIQKVQQGGETCHYHDLPKIAFYEEELEHIEKPAVDDSDQESSLI